MPNVVVQQPVISTAIYAVGDAVGGLLTFNFDFGSNPVLLNKAEVLDDDASPDSAALTLELFTDPAMVKADQAAFTVSQADYLAGKYLGSLSFSTYAATPVGNAAALSSVLTSVNRLLPLIQGKVYGQLVAVATPTFNATNQLLVQLQGTKL